MLEKKVLSPEEMEAQTALVLPDRELMALVKIDIGNVTIIRDISVAANICGTSVAVLSAQLNKGPVKCGAFTIHK